MLRVLTLFFQDPESVQMVEESDLARLRDSLMAEGYAEEDDDVCDCPNCVARRGEEAEEFKN
jgi:hypothetical protein